MFPYYHNANVALKQLSTDDNTAKLQMQQILSHSFAGQDVSKYFPEVAKLLANNDIVVKKSACWFIARHCTDPDKVLLVLNSLFGYCKQPNPILKVLGIQTLSALPLKNQTEYVVMLFQALLDDSNPLVRRAAVLGCSKVYLGHLTSEEGGGLVLEKLKSMVTDGDPLVSLNVMRVLLEMSVKGRGACPINKHTAVHIVNSLEKYPGLLQSEAINLLRSYKVTTLEEALDLMNALESHLKGRCNPSKTFSMLSVFLGMVQQHLPHLHSEVTLRFKVSLLDHLNFDGKEVVCALIGHLKALVKNCREVFVDDCSLFLCSRGDPPYTKLEKLDIYLSLVTLKNQKLLLNNIKEVVRFERHADTRFKAIKVLGSMMRSCACCSTLCIRDLLELASSTELEISLAVVDELVMVDYSLTPRGVREKVVKVILEWILSPDMSRTTLASAVACLGFFGGLGSRRSNCNPIEKILAGSDCFDLSQHQCHDDNDDAGGDDDDDAGGDDDDAGGGKEEEALLDAIIHKLEDVFEKLDIIEYSRDEIYFIPDDVIPILSSLLTTVSKHFLRRPAQCQYVLVELLDVCSGADSLLLRQKCFRYQRILDAGATRLGDYFADVSKFW